MMHSYRSRRSQRGAVLVVALIMLAVMTLLVITMIKTAVLDLKIGGANQQAALNLANAEVALTTYLASNPLNFSVGCLNRSAPEANCKLQLGAQQRYGSQVTVTATELGCTPGGERGTKTQIGSLPSVVFDARAESKGMFAGVAASGATAVHQGIRATAPAGTC